MMHLLYKDECAGFSSRFIMGLSFQCLSSVCYLRSYFLLFSRPFFVCLVQFYSSSLHSFPTTTAVCPALISVTCVLYFSPCVPITLSICHIICASSFDCFLVLLAHCCLDCVNILGFVFWPIFFLFAVLDVLDLFSVVQLPQFTFRLNKLLNLPRPACDCFAGSNWAKWE